MEASDWFTLALLFLAVFVMVRTRDPEPKPTVSLPIDRARLRRTDPVWRDKGTL